MPGSSIRTCAPARPTGCRSKTISGCSRASRVRRFSSAAAKVFCPTLPRAGVMKHFEKAELARIEGAGHWLQHDKPDEVLDLLEKFFRVGRTEIGGLEASPLAIRA